MQPHVTSPLPPSLCRTFTTSYTGTLTQRRTGGSLEARAAADVASEHAIQLSAVRAAHHAVGAFNAALAAAEAAEAAAQEAKGMPGTEAAERVAAFRRESEAAIRAAAAAAVMAGPDLDATLAPGAASDDSGEDEKAAEDGPAGPASSSGAPARAPPQWEGSSEAIPRAPLTSRDPILYFDELPLFESELDDHGSSRVSVKVEPGRAGGRWGCAAPPSLLPLSHTSAPARPARAALPGHRLPRSCASCHAAGTCCCASGCGWIT